MFHFLNLFTKTVPVDQQSQFPFVLFFSSHSRCVRWYLSDSVPLFCPVFPISMLYSFHINHCSVSSLTRRHLFTSLSPPLPQITANWVLLVCALRAEQCISSLQRPLFEDFKLEMGADSKAINAVLSFYCSLHGSFKYSIFLQGLFMLDS